MIGPGSWTLLPPPSPLFGARLGLGRVTLHIADGWFFLRGFNEDGRDVSRTDPLRYLPQTLADRGLPMPSDTDLARVVLPPPLVTLGPHGFEVAAPRGSWANRYGIDVPMLEEVVDALDKPGGVAGSAAIRVGIETRIEAGNESARLMKEILECMGMWD